MEILILFVLFFLLGYSIDEYLKEKEKYEKTKKIVKTYLQFGKK